MKTNPFTNAIMQGVVAVENANEAWQQEVAKREKWLNECRAFFDAVVRRNLMLAAEASGHWGYDARVSDVKLVENFTGKKYLRCEFVLHVDKYLSQLDFVLAVDSKIFTAEAVKRTGKKRFPKAAVEGKQRVVFVEDIIKEFLKWAVV